MTESVRSTTTDIEEERDLVKDEHRALFAAWNAARGAGTVPPADALDTVLPTLDPAHLVVVRRTEPFTFVYDHYGEGLTALTGFRLAGQTLSLKGYKPCLDVASTIGDLYVRKYEECLVRGRAIVTLNQAQINARVHAWERLLLPFGRIGEPGARVVADIRPQLFRHEVLASLSTIAQFGSATLEPVRGPDGAGDFIMIEATALAPVLGGTAPLNLSGLLGRPLTADLGTRLATAAAGECVLSETREIEGPSGPRAVAIEVFVAPVRPFVTVKDVTAEAAAMRARDESEQRLVDFLETASDWCWQSDTEHRVVAFGKDAKPIAGVGRDVFLGRTRREFPVIPEDRPVIERHFEDLEARRPFKNLVYSIRDVSGEIRTISASGKPVFGADGSFLGYRGTGSDVTELKRAERLLAFRTQQLREAHRMGHIGTWRRTLDAEAVEWSPECYELLRYDPSKFETTRDNIIALYEDATGVNVTGMIRRVVETRETLSCDVRYRRGDGTIADFLVTCGPEIGPDGRLTGLFGTMQDISARKEAERQLERLAFYDPLTGLTNRALFKRRLEETIAEAAGEAPPTTLLLIDLDRFKEVNDSLGHAAGDQLLTRVGELLTRLAAREDVVARLGGDEFALITRRAPGEIERLAAGIIECLSTPMRLANGEAFVGASIGMAAVPGDAATAEEALRHADLALTAAKSKGRGRTERFHRALAEMVEQRLDLARHLRQAVADGGLSAHYQPQVDLTTGRVEGFEALMRWTHPERGPISPSEFIPIAESSGLIVDLGLWILREACAQGRRWLDAGAPPRTISVNVSPAQFWNLDFEAAVARALADTGFPADLLCLELTEGLFVDQNEARVRRTLDALAKLGVRLALDDFGTGYSSLGYLTRLPFHRLKIARPFVDGVATTAKKRKILEGIVALGRGLGMTVVAEGAELAAEVEVLRELGCDVVQGFFYARPAAPEDALPAALAIDARAGEEIGAIVDGLRAFVARMAEPARGAGRNARRG